MNLNKPVRIKDNLFDLLYNPFCSQMSQQVYDKVFGQSNDQLFDKVYMYLCDELKDQLHNEF